jgi:hypothetical protein
MIEKQTHNAISAKLPYLTIFNSMTYNSVAYEFGANEFSSYIFYCRHCIISIGKYGTKAAFYSKIRRNSLNSIETYNLLTYFPVRAHSPFIAHHSSPAPTALLCPSRRKIRRWRGVGVGVNGDRKWRCILNVGCRHGRI